MKKNKSVICAQIIFRKSFGVIKHSIAGGWGPLDPPNLCRVKVTDGKLWYKT